MFGGKRLRKTESGASQPPAGLSSNSSNNSTAGSNNGGLPPASPARPSSNRSYYSAGSNSSNNPRNSGHPAISLPMPLNQGPLPYSKDVPEGNSSLNRVPPPASKDLPPVAEHGIYRTSSSPTKGSHAEGSSHRRTPSGQAGLSSSMASSSSSSIHSHAHSNSGGNNSAYRPSRYRSGSSSAAGGGQQQEALSSRHTSNSQSTSLSHTPSIRSVRSAGSAASSSTSNAPSSEATHNTSGSNYLQRPPAPSHAGSSFSGPIPASPAPSEFNFPKPERQDEIDTMFLNLVERLGVSQPTPASRAEMLALPVETKWRVIQAHKHKDRSSQSSFSAGHLKDKIRGTAGHGASGSGSGAAGGGSHHSMVSHSAQSAPAKSKGALKKDSPEYYLGAFFDKTVDHKMIAHLNVSLRTYEIAWLHSFIDLRGLTVLSNHLRLINRNQSWEDDSLSMEYELIKALKTLTSVKNGILDALDNPKVFIDLAMSLTSPHIPTRKLICDILVFTCYFRPPESHSFVLEGIDTLAKMRGEVGRFDAWFASFETIIDGRGRMGSLVGASDEIKSLRGKDMAAAMAARDGNATTDSALSEYALANFLLINGLLASSAAQDLHLRIHIRNQMEASGLRRILSKLEAFNHPLIDKQTEEYEAQAEHDMKSLQELCHWEEARDLSTPDAVFHALMLSVWETRAQDFLLSALKHLLLIPDDIESKVRYHRLFDRLVSSIVMDRNAANQALEGNFSSMFGTSVEDVINRFTDSDRLQQATEEAAAFKQKNSRLKSEKAALEDQLMQQQGGFVDELKSQLTRAEDDLNTSRQASQSLQDHMEDIEKTHAAKVAELELQIRELFRMLQEARMLEVIEDENGILPRRELLSLMKKKLERTRTVYALEGKSREGRQSQKPGEAASEADLEEEESQGSRAAARRSAFEDANEEDVRAHIEEALANGASSPGRPIGKPSSPQSARNVKRSPPVRKSMGGLYGHQVQRFHPESLSSIEDSEGTSQFQAAETPSKTPRPTHDASSPLARMSNAARAQPAKTDSRSAMFAQIRARKDPDSDAEEDAEESPAHGKQDDSDRDESSEATLSTASRVTIATSMTSAGVPNTPTKAGLTQTSQVAPVAAAPPPPPPPPPPPASAPSASAPPPPPAAPPPPPPPGAAAAGVSAAAPPAPPPPPPPGGGAGGSGRPPLAFASELLAGAKLRPTGSGEPNTSTDGPPVPRAPASPAPPPPAPPGGMRPTAAQQNKMKKAVAFSARQRTKQVQWDQVAANDLSKTVWAQPGGTSVQEDHVAQMLKSEGFFDEMEQDFKTIVAVKNRVPNAVGTQKEKQLISVLTPKMRERIGIILSKQINRDETAHGTFTQQVDNLIRRIYQVDDDLCTDAFLDQLKPVLPTPEDVGKLSSYKGAAEEVMETLNKADRFMVALIQIYRLPPRVDGMLFRASFEENSTSLRRRITAIRDGCEALQPNKAPHLRDLLNVALTLGNFLNANIKGGAYGFRLSSLNKFIDCKSDKGKTLLHTLQRVISTRFPEIEGFREEIEKPVAAYRYSLDECEKEVSQLFTQLNTLKKELKENFEDIDNVEEILSPDDRYPSVMYRFSREATSELGSLRDQVTLSKSMFRDALQLYQEDHRSQSTSEFFSILKTFSVSYDNVARDNSAAKEREEAMEKRKQAHEARKKEILAAKEATLEEGDDRQLADDLLSKLREGNLRGGKRAHRKGKPSITSSPTPSPTKYSTEDPGLIARDLLKELHGDAFEISAENLPKSSRPRRQNSMRSSTLSDSLSAMSSPVKSKRGTMLSLGNDDADDDDDDDMLAAKAAITEALEDEAPKPASKKDETSRPASPTSSQSEAAPGADETVRPDPEGPSPSEGT